MYKMHNYHVSVLSTFQLPWLCILLNNVISLNLIQDFYTCTLVYRTFSTSCTCIPVVTVTCSIKQIINYCTQTLSIFGKPTRRGLGTRLHASQRSCSTCTYFTLADTTNHYVRPVYTCTCTCIYNVHVNPITITGLRSSTHPHTIQTPHHTSTIGLHYHNNAYTCTCTCIYNV